GGRGGCGGGGGGGGGRRRVPPQERHRLFGHGLQGGDRPERPGGVLPGQVVPEAPELFGGKLPGRTHSRRRTAEHQGQHRNERCETHAASFLRVGGQPPTGKTVP